MKDTKQGDNGDNSIKKRIGVLKNNKYFPFIIAILFVVLFALISRYNTYSVSNKAVDYLERNFDIDVEILEVSRDNGLVLTKVEIDGYDTLEFYVTLDGSRMFIDSIDLDVDMYNPEKVEDEELNIDLDNEDESVDIEYDFIDDENKLVVYFFWGDGCPYCEQVKPHLEEWESKYDNLEIKRFEIWNLKSNYDIFELVHNAYDLEPTGVPVLFVGNEFYVGYDENVMLDVEEYIEKCLGNETCPNPGDLVIDLEASLE